MLLAFFIPSSNAKTVFHQCQSSVPIIKHSPNMAPSYWATQSRVTEPGKAATSIDELASDLAALRAASSQLVFHYRAGDFAKHSVPVERKREIDLRYAAALLEVVQGRGDPSLARARQPIDAVVGCCRDATVLFLALARHKGIPARGRVGFASYIRPGWFLDHVVAEVWDAAEGRWRLVDPEMEASFRPKVKGKAVDWLDLTDDEFITGPKAWQAAREGKADPSRFVVAPELELPFLRGWAYLAHNVVHDLAFVYKKEMLLWDEWGMLAVFDGDAISEDDSKVMDEISAVTYSVDVEPAGVEELMARDGLRLTPTIVSADPMGGPLRTVDISQLLST